MPEIKPKCLLPPCVVVQTFLTSNLTWCSNLSFGVIIRVESEAFQVSILTNQKFNTFSIEVKTFWHYIMVFCLC